MWILYAIPLSLCGKVKGTSRSSKCCARNLLIFTHSFIGVHLVEAVAAQIIDVTRNVATPVAVVPLTALVNYFHVNLLCHKNSYTDVWSFDSKQLEQLGIV